jgi:predicted HTH domain antitoxin
MSIQLTVDFPEEILTVLQIDPQTFVKEMRLVAAVKWFELGTLSQAKAAELAGLSRQEFIETLERFQVSPIQMTPLELATEFSSDE